MQLNLAIVGKLITKTFITANGIQLKLTTIEYEMFRFTDS